MVKSQLFPREKTVLAEHLEKARFEQRGLKQFIARCIYSGRRKSESASKIGSVFGNGSDRAHGRPRILCLNEFWGAEHFFDRKNSHLHGFRSLS